MKNWKAPAIILGLLILAFVFRWGDLSSTTNNGTTVKTKIDHWNGAVWQETIKNGSYTEKIISSGWIESSREPIEKQVEYKKPYYKKVDTSLLEEVSKSKIERIFDIDNSEFVAQVNVNPANKDYDYDYDSLPEVRGWIKTFEMKEKTVKEPPTPIYWLSSKGLTKIWIYIALIIGMWSIISVVITKKREEVK